MPKKKSRAAGSRVLVLVFSIIIVVSAVPVGPVGVASAGHTECSEVDEFFWVLSIGLVNSEKCDSSELSDHAEELEQDAENKTELDIYSTATQTEADSEQFLTVFNNSVKESGTVAMSKGEAAAIQAIEAGKTRVEVKEAAEAAVEEYYATKQKNLNDQWLTTAETVLSMQNTYQAAGVGKLLYQENYDQGHADCSGGGIDDPIIQNSTVGLVNGNSTDTKEYRIYQSGGGDCSTGSATTGIDHIDTISGTYASGTFYAIHIVSVDGNPSFQVVNMQNYVDVWTFIETKNTQVVDNARKLADGLYNKSENESLNVSDYVSGSTLAQEYATNYNDTGYYAYLVGHAGAQGMAVPDLENTSLMTISTGSGTYNGLLMSQGDPPGDSWEVGVTYDPTSIEGKQFVATEDGNVAELTGNFTITSMEGPDGEPVNVTTNQHYTYDVSNASESYEEVQSQLRDLRNELESLEPAGGSGGGGGDGGGGFSFDLGLGSPVGIGVVAAAFIVGLLLGRG